jgi:hypothetical protein
MQVLLSFRPSDDEGLIEASVDSETQNKLKNLNNDLFDPPVDQEIVFIQDISKPKIKKSKKNIEF